MTWPFWNQVLVDFPDVRVIPLGLLRSPHEIAMSLVTRRSGLRGYWESLDVIAVHLRRQKLILENAGTPVPCLCFGGLDYLKSLEIAVNQCGLTWNAATVLEIFDRSAVHQQPAAIHHEAQDLFDSMCGDNAAYRDFDSNQLRRKQTLDFSRTFVSISGDHTKSANRNPAGTAKGLSRRLRNARSATRRAA